MQRTARLGAASMDDSEASPPVEEPTKAGRKRQARVNPGQPIGRLDGRDGKPCPHDL